MHMSLFPALRPERYLYAHVNSYGNISFTCVTLILLFTVHKAGDLVTHYGFHRKCFVSPFYLRLLA